MCRRDLVVAGDLIGAQVTVQCVAFDADFDHVPRIPGSNRAVFEDQLRELLDAEFLDKPVRLTVLLAIILLAATIETFLTSATTRIQHFIRWQGFVVCVGFVV